LPRQNELITLKEEFTMAAKKKKPAAKKPAAKKTVKKKTAKKK